MTLLTTHVEGEDVGGGRHRQVIHLKPIAYPHQGGLRRITNLLANSGDPSLPIGVDELIQFRVRDRLAGASPVYHFGKGQSRVRFTPLGTNNINGQVSGQSTTFPGAWQGADLRLTIAGHILHEDILLYAGHPRTFAFRLDDHQGFDPLTLSTPDFRIVNPVLTHPINPLSVPLAWQTSQQGGKWILSVTLPDGDWRGWTLDPTIVLQPGAAAGKDLQLYAASPTFNYGIDTVLAIGLVTAVRRSVCQFDLSSIVGTLSAVTLGLYDTDWAARTASGTLTAARVLAANAAWVEGTKSNEAEEGSSCWNALAYHAAGNVNWAGSAGLGTSGTDYSSTPLGTVDWTDGVAGWLNINCSVAECELMRAANAGIRLVATDEGTEGKALLVASSDAVDPATRPTLTVVTQEATTPLFILRRRR